jgi:hypothetical protein
MTINKRISALEAELAALKAEAAKPKPFTGQPGWPMLDAPEEGASFWVSEAGGVEAEWDGDRFDRNGFDHGRCYENKKDAEAASLRECTTHKLCKVIAEVTAEVAPGWVPDWGAMQDKSYLWFNANHWKIGTVIHIRIPGVIYFPPEAGPEIIRRMGAELDNLL